MQSPLVLSELGAARFRSMETERLLVMPVIIDAIEIPKVIDDLTAISDPDLNPDALALQIHQAVCTFVEQRLMHDERGGTGSASAGAERVKLFISHAHRDVDIADRLVTAVDIGMDVPPGAIRCTSVPGYQLDLGSMPRDTLAQELTAVECVLAILTPNSLASQWVLFELGATWGLAKSWIPLLAGGLKDDQIPGPFRGAHGGQLSDSTSLVQCFDQLTRTLGWPSKNTIAAYDKLTQIATFVATKSFFENDADKEIKASFGAKRARIGRTQGEILDYVIHNGGNRPYIPQQELAQKFKALEASLYYRLEQLRYLGFLSRQEVGVTGGRPDYGWAVSASYRAELGSK